MHAATSVLSLRLLAVVVKAFAVLWRRRYRDKNRQTQAELLLTDEERLQLQSLARNRSLSAALSNLARLVLASDEGGVSSFSVQ